MALQLAVIAGALLFASWRFHRQQLAEAQITLRESGDTLVPFMVQSISPALELAVDSMTGDVDDSMMQEHIIVAAFETAKKNRDLVYADLLLAGERHVGTFLAPGTDKRDIDRLFQQAGDGRPLVMRGDLIGHQGDILAKGQSTALGTLRVAHSLARVEARAEEALATTALIGLLVFAVAALLTLAMGHTLIYAPLKGLLTAVQAIASGRLVTSVGFKTAGELGLLAGEVRGMSGALSVIVSRIQETAAGVTASVTNLGRRAEHSLAGARQQSVALDKISGAMDEIDRASRAVDADLAALMAAANQVATDTAALSQGMTALEPQVGEFATFVRQTDDAMQRMATGASAIADNVAAMAEATDDAATTVIEFEESVRLIGVNTDKAAVLSKDVERRADEGKQAVDHSVEGMRAVASTFTAIAHAVDDLGKSVDAIGRALSVITEVTQRTQLLSLNASILAAQAGEHGRAFAVVADEIKALSARTSASTGDIARTLAALAQGRERTSEAMAAGLKSVEDGERLGQNTRDAITAILALSARSHSQIAEIARATQEQIVGSRQITAAITRIAEMGRAIGSTSQDQKSAAESVTALTARMVTTLQTVEGVIRKEVAASVRTADQIQRVLEMAASISQQSSNQEETTAAAVAGVVEVRDFSGQVVSVAETVAAEATTLSEQAESLRASIAHFEVDRSDR